MTNIIYNRERLSVTVNGHAGSEEEGKDIVCASLSILVHTLASNAEMLSSGRSGCYKPEITISDGNASIRCKPQSAYRNIARLVFDGICTGFDILAQKYPAYVTYNVEG